MRRDTRDTPFFGPGSGLGLRTSAAGAWAKRGGCPLLDERGMRPSSSALCPHLIPLQDLRRRRGRGVRSGRRARLDALCQDPDRRNLRQRARHFRGHSQVCAHAVAIAHSGLPASPSLASVTLSALSVKRQARSTSTITSPPPFLYSTPQHYNVEQRRFPYEQVRHVGGQRERRCCGMCCSVAK